jgi:hypothetical protein
MACLSDPQTMKPEIIIAARGVSSHETSRAFPSTAYRGNEYS